MAQRTRRKTTRRVHLDGGWVIAPTKMKRGTRKRSAAWKKAARTFPENKLKVAAAAG